MAWRSFIEEAPASIAIYDRSLRFLAASRRYREGIGAGDQNIVGRPACEIVPGWPQLRERHEAALAGEAVQVERTALVAADGSIRWLRIDYQPWCDGAGRIGGIMTFREDITERVCAEEARAAATAELSAIIAASPVAIFMLDMAGIVRLWNASAERIFGYSEEEALGRLPPYLVDEDAADFRANLERVAADASATGSLESRRRRKDGKTIDIAARWARVHDVSGQITGTMHAVADVTDQKKVEAQLVQAQKMEAIGNLTGGIAHDFNNLLGVVIGNLDLLSERQGGDAEAEELARQALDAALRGAQLTQRLLAFARRQPLQPRLVVVNAMIVGIGRLLSRTLGEHIDIAFDLADELWPVVVDPAQLEASLTNLATNARDAMPAGGHLIVVTGNRDLDADYASLHPEVRPGQYAMIEVSDTGSGMPADIAGRIFEPFFTTKAANRGTGLGLSMVFGFIKQSGGHINVYSEEGIGTTFRLYLPRAAAGAEAAASPELPKPLRGGGETVLAVEDNAGLRRVVVRQLSEFGYRVLEAADAQEALDVLEREAADLLFTDVVMPGGTGGYELARLAQLRRPGIRVVLTSGFPEPSINGNGHIPGLPLLSKPYRRDDLGRAIRAALDRE
jgi:PAS domain S-box-containing protein